MKFKQKAFAIISDIETNPLPMVHGVFFKSFRRKKRCEQKEGRFA